MHVVAIGNDMNFKSEGETMAIEYIQTLDVLYKVVAGGETIVWTNVTPGVSLLNLLRYTGRMNVCSVVQERVSAFNRFSCGVPIIHLALMPHFRDTATFIVAAPINKNELFYGKLANYGCKKIFCLTEDVHKAVQSELKRLKDSGETTLWQMKYLMNKMKRMEHLINMQHEICKVNTASFEPYRNCFRGKKVVIVNDGPTRSPMRSTSPSKECGARERIFPLILCSPTTPARAVEI